MFLRLLLTLGSLLFLLTGCSLFQKKKEEIAKPRTTAVVGEVTSVHDKEGFILFRRYGPGELLSDGFLSDGFLSARSLDGRRASGLTLSPEKLGRFYTADFDKEAVVPREGDLIVLSKLTTDTQNEAFGTKKTENFSLKSKKTKP